MINGVNQRAEAVRKLTLVLYTGLLGLMTLSTLLADYDKVRVQVFVLLLQVLPLLCFLPGMIKRKFKSYLWLCLVLLVYFTVVVTRLFMPKAGWMEYLQLGFQILLFISATIYARWRQQQLAGQELLVS